MKNKSDMAYFTTYMLLGTKAAADTALMAMREKTSPASYIGVGCMGVLAAVSFIMAIRSLAKALK